MGVPIASGLPDYGPAGTINFNPELYSAKLVEKFYKTTVFGEIASTDYEGDITGFGAQVKIRTIPDVTVSDYVVGAGLNPQYPTNNSVTLAIDRAKSFAVALSTVDSRQSDLDRPTSSPTTVRSSCASRPTRTCSPRSLRTWRRPTRATPPAPIRPTSTSAVRRRRARSPRPTWWTSSSTAARCSTRQNVSDEGRWMVAPPWFIALIKEVRSAHRVAGR